MTPLQYYGKRCPECNRQIAVSSIQQSVQCSFCKNEFRVLATLSHGVKLEKIE